MQVKPWHAEKSAEPYVLLQRLHIITPGPPVLDAFETLGSATMSTSRQCSRMGLLQGIVSPPSLRSYCRFVSSCDSRRRITDSTDSSLRIAFELREFAERSRLRDNASPSVQLRLQAQQVPNSSS
jgi:hypothetical protein